MPAIEVQIFGTKADAETRKAQRFFAERRVKVHFVDVKQHPAKPGELRKWAQKFGVRTLVDNGSKRFADLGLGQRGLTEERWLQLLCDEPGVLKMPLCRCGKELTVGAAEDEWRKWVSTG